MRNAIEIGFLAPVPEERIVKSGNARSPAHARCYSPAGGAEIEELVKGVEHVELETIPDFFDLFVEGCQFKPMPGGKYNSHGRVTPAVFRDSSLRQRLANAFQKRDHRKKSSAS